MTIWRLDEQLLWLSNRCGPEWSVVAVLCLAGIAFARLSHSFLIAIAVLMGSLVWFEPMIDIARVLRWWVFGILAVRGAVWVLRASRSGPSFGRVPRSVIALGALAAASCAWAEVPWFSAVLAGTFVCSLLLCYVVAWRIMDTYDFLPRLCVAALALALLLHGLGLLFGAAALISNDPVLSKATGVSEGRRFAGMMLNANGNGVFAALLWPIVLAAPRAYLGRLGSLRWVALVALAVAIVFSGSRTALGVTLMTTFVYALYRFRAGAVLTTTVVGVAGAVLLLAAPMEELEGAIEGSAVDRVMLRSDTLYDLGGRLERWQQGWDAAQDALVFGHGWGAARTLDNQDIEQSLDLGRVRYATNLHSAHVSLLVDVGFVGLFVFWLFGASVIRSGVRILAAPPSPESTVSVLFFASTLGMLANTFVHNDILSAGSPGAFLFWFSTAVVSKQAQRIQAGLHLPEPEPEPAVPQGLVAGPA